MRKNMKIQCLFFPLVIMLNIVFFQQYALATTWNEPWHESIVRGADSFGLFIVDDHKGNTTNLTLLKHLAGIKTPEKIKLEGFFHLEITSSSPDHPPSFHMNLEKEKRYYLYLKKAKEKDVWQIGTPTAGINGILDDGRIEATYRISPHATAIDSKIFEKTQTCIFYYLHQKPCKTIKEIKEFINLSLSKPVGKINNGISSDESIRFFEQHAALETAYLLNLSLEESILDKFIGSDSHHVQISGIRAFSKSNAESKAVRLVNIIESKKTLPIVKVFAVFGLDHIDERSVISQLKELEKSLPEDQAWLGVNIMDPRIGTSFPESTKEAILWLLKKWDSTSSGGGK